MRSTANLFVFALILSCTCLAQPYEVGGAVGFGWYRDVSITNPTGQAKAGFDARFAGGAVIGDNLYQHLGGELRYTYRDGDLRLQSGGVKVGMEGNAHALHYDFLIHTRPKGAKVRPFAAGGAGIKIYKAIGREFPTQPLSNFALLTKVDQWEPLISFGGGVKCEVSQHMLFRADFRDYVTPTPEKLFTPVKGATLKGWLHDFVPLVGVSYVF